MKNKTLVKYKRYEEDIVLPINKNDIIFYGKFKNKKGVVADIIKNEKGDYFVVLDSGKQIPLLRVRLGLGEEVHKFSESLRFSDLMKMASLSPFTRDYNKETNKLMGNPTNHTKLKSAKFNIKKDYVTFKWVTKRTPKYPKGYKMKAYDPKLGGLIPVRLYTIEIRVLDFFKLLNTSPIDITNKDIEDVLKVADIQIFSSVPMFQFQGANFNMTMFDASIYPENRPPKYWNKVVSKFGKTHDEKQFLDKHTAGVVNSISFYIPIMRQIIKSFMIKKGMLKGTNRK